MNINIVECVLRNSDDVQLVFDDNEEVLHIIQDHGEHEPAGK